MDPVFDDVGYLLDGLQRLNVLDTAGFRALCNSFVQSPPHSPWSTLLAFIAFDLMGVHDWAPYILNGFLVFLLLLLGWHLVGLKNDGARAAILSVILLLPLPFQAVLEFRPDFAVALFTAAFALLLVRMGCYGDESGTGIPPSSAAAELPPSLKLLRTRRRTGLPVGSPGHSQPAGATRIGSPDLRNHFFNGLLAGLAYLAKPTFFPHTTVMLFAAISLAEISRWQVSRRGPKMNPVAARGPRPQSTAADRVATAGWARALQISATAPSLVGRVLATLAGAGLLAGPYFIFSWRSVLDYLLTNTGTGKDAVIWKVSGGFLAALSSRLWGYPTYLMLGSFAGVLTIWLALGLIFASVRRNRRAVLFILSGVALAAVSLLLISAGGMVDPHFSLTWEILFLLTTLFAVAEITKTERASFLGIVFCAMALFTFYKAPPTRNVWTVFQDTARGQSLNEVIVRQIAARVPSDFRGRPPVIYSTFMGKVNSASQSWLALKVNLNLTFRDLHRSGDIEEHLAAIQAADFVEVADPASQWLDRWLPSASLQSSLLEKLRNLSDFRELTPVVGKEGTVFLFEKHR